MRDVHHDIHPAQLTPHLDRTTKTDTSKHPRLEQIHITLRALRTFELDLVPDLIELKLYELVVLVASAVQVREDFECLLFPV